MPEPFDVDAHLPKDASVASIFGSRMGRAVTNLALAEAKQQALERLEELVPLDSSSCLATKATSTLHPDRHEQSYGHTFYSTVDCILTAGG